MKKIYVIAILLGIFASTNVLAVQTKSVRVVVDLEIIESDMSNDPVMHHAYIILSGNNRYYKEDEILCRRKSNKSMLCKGTMELPEGFYEILIKHKSEGFHTERKYSPYYNSATANIRILGATREPQTSSVTVRGSNIRHYSEVRDYNSVFDFEVRIRN